MNTKNIIAASILPIRNGGKMKLDVWAACAVLATLGASAVARAEGGAADTVSAFYVGNWMLDGSMPPFHPALGKSAGKEWNAAAVSDLKLTPYMCLYMFKSDWTYKDRATWSSFSGVKPLKDVFTGHSWTSLVVQPYGWMGLHRNRADMGVWMTDELAKTLGADDFGDVESIVRLYELFQKQRPDIELVIFQSWPELPLQRGADGAPVQLSTEPTADGCRIVFDGAKHRTPYYVVEFETR